MARYYFHLRAGETYVADMEGAELEKSSEAALHLMRMLDRVGSSDYRGWSFEITDETGEFLDSIRVEDLVGAVH